MPYIIKKNDDGTYMVTNAITGKVHAYHTTLANAHAQIRVMEMFDNEKVDATPKKKKPKRKPRKRNKNI